MTASPKFLSLRLRIPSQAPRNERQPAHVRCTIWTPRTHALTRLDAPRQLAAYVGLIPSEYSSGATRRQGSITKAGNGRARRALIEAAWAYRHPAKVSQHIQTR